MDQTLFNWVLSGVSVLGGWILKVIWDSIREMRQELRIIDTKMHNDFVRRDDFKEAVKDIKEDVKQGFNKVDQALSRLELKLDNKADAE